MGSIFVRGIRSKRIIFQTLASMLWIWRWIKVWPKLGQPVDPDLFTLYIIQLYCSDESYILLLEWSIHMWLLLLLLLCVWLWSLHMLSFFYRCIMCHYVPFFWAKHFFTIFVIHFVWFFVIPYPLGFVIMGLGLVKIYVCLSVGNNRLTNKQQYST